MTIIRLVPVILLQVFVCVSIISEFGYAQARKSNAGKATAINTGTIRQMAYADSLRLVDTYKDLHQNPELGFMEVRTSGIIAKELQLLGFQVITGIGKTGVVGILKNGDGPVVMYRADMDCNSVKEITGLPYASTKTMKKEDGTETPVMHACGHDAHVTWMLGVARIMVAMKDQWKGTLVFLGQPAEEPLMGARAMVADNMYDKGVPVPDYLFALHTWPIPTGTIENGPGVRFSGSDQLDVTFFGIGGHGSRPEVAKDPVVMACNAVMQYQTIISRGIAAQDAAVLTVGAIHAGVDNNVIPSSAVVKLNLRWFNEKTRKVLLDGIRRINEGIAVSNGLAADAYPKITMKGNVNPLVNDTALTAKVNAALNGVLSPAGIDTERPSSMGSEDFQHLIKPGQKTVYNYIRVGTAHPDLYAKAIAEGKPAPYFNHNGNYQVDLSAIPLGTVIGATGLMALFKQ
ncbi:MAG: amidohydrolase [Chitinophagaceae bacterium]|jgi:hippurate hydrolase|nr:amidohydrolase [Chitinophagaceae bacterium]